MSKPKESWVGQYAAFNEALKYMFRRSTGEEKSIYTPWPKFNDAATDGLEWNTLTVIGGRPGSGKTLIKDQIIRESFALNPNDNFRVLEFQFEMVGRTSAIRELRPRRSKGSSLIFCSKNMQKHSRTVIRKY